MAKIVLWNFSEKCAWLCFATSATSTYLRLNLCRGGCYGEIHVKNSDMHTLGSIVVQVVIRASVFVGAVLKKSSGRVCRIVCASTHACWYNMVRLVANADS